MTKDESIKFETKLEELDDVTAKNLVTTILLEAEIARLRAEIARLEIRIAELEESRASYYTTSGKWGEY